jgi:hypothetical protein
METFRISISAIIFTDVVAENADGARAIGKRIIRDATETGRITDGWPVPVGECGRCFISSNHQEEMTVDGD